MKYNPPYGITDPDAPYINGDPSIAQAGSILPAEAAEFPQREIVGLIQSSQRIPTNDDLLQLTRSVRSQWLNFCVDGGTVNSLVVTLDPPLIEYRQGLPLRVLIANPNTGPTVINVNALGNRPVRRAGGGELAPNDLKAGMIAEMADDGTAFQMTNFLAPPAGGVTNTYLIHIPYAEDSSLIPNQIVASFSPAITTVQPGDVVIVKVKNKNTGAVTLQPNAMSAMPVLRNDGQPLQASDLLNGEAIMLEYNTSYWQLLRLARSQVYIKLTTDLIVYVRPDGNDLNDGSANDSGHAFQHIQAAIDYCHKNFLLGTQQVTIQLGIPGTYVLVNPQGPSIKIFEMPGSYIIRGDPLNKLSYIVQGPAGGGAANPLRGPIFWFRGSGVTVQLSGFTLSPVATGQNLVITQDNASLLIGDMAVVGPTISGVCFATGNGASLRTMNTIDFYSNCAAMFSAANNGSVVAGIWKTILKVHGITFSAASCWCGQQGNIAISAQWTTISGAGYGLKYVAVNGSTITTYGGPNYLPGSQPGVTDASSHYG
jgi:hypothetical protein